MKNNAKKLIPLLLTFIMLLSLSVTASAAAAKKISITGSLKTMVVGQKKELDTKITPKRAKVRDRNIVWTSSNPKVIRILENYDDETEIKALKAGTATITVSIKGTNLKASRKITVKNSSAASVSSYTKKISSCTDSLKDIYNSIKKAAVKSGYSAARRQAQTYENKLEKIEDQLDELEDTIKSLYRSGKFTASQYNSLKKKLKSADRYADKAEDYLEGKFGDFD